MDDKTVIAHILKQNGAIFGGYIRDLISSLSTNKEIESNDIDCVIGESKYYQFRKELIKHGYTESSVEEDVILFTIEGKKPIQVVICDDDDPFSIISCTAKPDYDVNTLQYGPYPYTLISWTEETDIFEVIANILTKLAISQNDNIPDDRKQKIIKKGYDIDATNKYIKEEEINETYYKVIEFFKDITNRKD